MKLLKPILLAVFVFNMIGLQAQDIPHYTLFTYTPLSTNPANTGAFLGTVRLGGHFRDQAFTLSPNTYITPSFYGDSPILRGFRKTDWIGVGANIYSDQAGTIGLQTSAFMGSVAYHFGLNKKQTSSFSIGVQAGSLSRSIGNFNEISTEETVAGPMGTLATDDSKLVMDPNSTAFNLNVGLLYKNKANKQTHVTLGVALNNIITPQYNLLNNNQTDVDNKSDSVAIDLPFNITLHGEFDFMMNKKWTLSPAFLVNNNGRATEGVIQAWMGLKPDPKKDKQLRFGLGYRVGDAAQALLGYHAGDFRFGFAYDLTLSQLSDINDTFGGFELGASYIIKIYKDPEIKPVIICPNL